MNRKQILLTMTAAGALAAQTVNGPVLAYVIDGEAHLRPLLGVSASAHVGDPTKENVKEAWGRLVLLSDGTAIQGEVALEGAWTALQDGVFVDATGQELLVAAGDRAPWRVTLPQAALSIRVSADGGQILTLLADESLAAWNADGSAAYQFAASKWWGIAYAGNRAIAYDPAANALLWIDAQGARHVARELDFEPGQYQLAADPAGQNAVLLGAQAMIVPLNGGDVKSVVVPDGAKRLEPVDGGRAFLLMRDPSQPMWILDPSREEPLLVVPALAVDKGGVK